ncbi:MAG: acetyl-CoA carboxylase biotin carboxylase subunit [Polyangiaceae bacterium]|nr:acetyl-CoA carboxylase biotin carboxylase subunit [Polyangiaceae bacterium]MCW5788821.1 acetyl-CoA carboxylase biotin carboxylase subunit [Polyangiaceae bacterium]
MGVSRILVANRGEIAQRIFRTAHEMGMGTVAVYSEADRGLPFVREAEQAVCIGPAPASESYLRVEAILAAARATGADAVHPGFGFLAENADFARACEAAGLTFIGPSADAIARMGSKREAKRLAEAAGVPVIPGYAGDDQSTEALSRAALTIGFPVLIKASAGGGGKGMRVALAEAELSHAIEGAKREAASAFGDDSLLIERYISAPRHVEIQILADTHGNLVHLLERECSIQRRHQKVIEEAPSVALDAALRARMGEAALAVAKSVSYTSAGTVEFILDEQKNFYFLEVNTRLQVEHPVTEAITGVDIVREQIRIALGERLELTQGELVPRGAAIECRLYAEDPGQGFLPTTGRLCDFWLPEQPGLRVDSGVEAGTEVSIHYDPMLAKIITWGADREEARRRLVRVLSAASVHGVVTNLDFLRQVLEHEAFIAGRLSTGFIAEHFPAPAPSALPEGGLEELACAALACDFEARRAERALLPGLTPGFRNNPSAPQRTSYQHQGATLMVSYRAESARRLTITVGERTFGFEVLSWRPPELSYEVTTEGAPTGGGAQTGGSAPVRRSAPIRRSARVVRDGERWFVSSPLGGVTLTELPRFPEQQAQVEPGAESAPMPGRVVQLLAQVGSSVEVGAPLVVLEAMKMEHTVRASSSGELTEVRVAVGDQVEGGDVLVVVRPSE